MASDGSRGGTALPSQPDRAGVRRIGAEDRARGLGPAGAEQAREADDLAGVTSTRASRTLRPIWSPSAESTSSPAFRRGGGKAGRVAADRLDVASEHRGDEMKLVDLRHAAAS